MTNTEQTISDIVFNIRNAKTTKIAENLLRNDIQEILLQENKKYKESIEYQISHLRQIIIQQFSKQERPKCNAVDKGVDCLDKRMKGENSCKSCTSYY